MAIDERSRHELYLKLEQVLGADEAATLMAHLPPVGWADVATKRDLEALKENLEASFRAEIRAEVLAVQRHLTAVIIGSMATAVVTVGGLAFAAARLV